MAIQVTDGIFTWSFSSDHAVGQYADGSWWVEGPVTINSIIPASSSGANGSMVNPAPGGDQAIDDTAADYNALLDISLPYTASSSESIISSSRGLVDHFSQWIEYCGVLTIVPSAPMAGSFRPPFWGSDKSLAYSTSDINYNKLHRLSPVQATPSLASTESWFSSEGHPYAEWGPLWSDKYKQAYGDYETYGRNFSHNLGTALLQLQLDYTPAQKEFLLVRLVQWGLDQYGYYANGGTTLPDGGHKHGRKAMVLLAGYVLGDAGILSVASGVNNFQEDQTTFYVSQADIDRTLNEGNIPYEQSDLGLSEWGIRHSTNPEQDNKDWGAPYRNVVGPSLVGHALTANMLGITPEWNNAAFFDYIDRLYLIMSPDHMPGYSNEINDFAYYMWESYRNVGPPKLTDMTNPDLTTTQPQAALDIIKADCDTLNALGVGTSIITASDLTNAANTTAGEISVQKTNQDNLNTDNSLGLTLTVPSGDFVDQFQALYDNNVAIEAVI